MNVLFIARATLYSGYGGDTVQILSTAKYLRKLGVSVDIKLCNETIDYEPYNLIHFFNITRPADALYHVRKSRKPYVVSTIFVDYSEYHQYHNRGVYKLLWKIFPGDKMEYLKTIARWLKNGESVTSKEYLFKGHRNAVCQLAKAASLLLPNSESEYRRFVKAYNIERPYRVIYNGVDPEIFSQEDVDIPDKRDSKTVLCVARIEGKKNQLNLIKALNNTEFNVILIGKPAPNHLGYYNECKEAAAPNIKFVGFLPLDQLIVRYRQAKVHVLPSWNETTGLSSLEAAWYGCNIVITDKGDTEEYFGDDAFYCDPADPKSIYIAILKASCAPHNDNLKNKILSKYNWQAAAVATLEAYNEVL